jgi:pyruvate formate lyase activating enzyme
MKMNSLAPVMGIDRLRMGTDGNGITSLVTFYGCPLKCRFCLNPQCHRDFSNIKLSRPNDVYDMVAIDELYYLATEGGVTFGGGEPLLYSDFIFDILELGAKKWNITIETSLNVPFERIRVLLPYINEIIVDVKDINPQIYERYTQSSNKVVLENLKLLATSGYAEKMLVRIPLINGYNKQDDVQKSKSFLEDMGYSAFDLFEYKTDNSYEG